MGTRTTRMRRRECVSLPSLKDGSARWSHTDSPGSLTEGSRHLPRPPKQRLRTKEVPSSKQEVTTNILEPLLRPNPAIQARTLTQTQLGSHDVKIEQKVGPRTPKLLDPLGGRTQRNTSLPVLTLHLPLKPISPRSRFRNAVPMKCGSEWSGSSSQHSTDMEDDGSVAFTQERENGIYKRNFRKSNRTISVKDAPTSSSSIEEEMCEEIFSEYVKDKSQRFLAKTTMADCVSFSGSADKDCGCEDVKSNPSFTPDDNVTFRKTGSEGFNRKMDDQVEIKPNEHLGRRKNQTYKRAKNILNISRQFANVAPCQSNIKSTSEQYKDPPNGYDLVKATYPQSPLIHKTFSQSQRQLSISTQMLAKPAPPTGKAIPTCSSRKFSNNVPRLVTRHVVSEKRQKTDRDVSKRVGSSVVPETLFSLKSRTLDDKTFDVTLTRKNVRETMTRTQRGNPDQPDQGSTLPQPETSRNNTTTSEVSEGFVNEVGDEPLTDDLLKCLAEELISLDEIDFSWSSRNLFWSKRGTIKAARLLPELPLNDAVTWTKGEVLGRGAYGTVHCGLTSAGQLIAVKQVNLDSSDPDSSELEYGRLREEVELLKSLKHDNIVGFLGTSLQKNAVSIFMEYIPGGSVASVLQRFGPLPERVLALYTRQILEGVVYLHLNRVVHRDLKGKNVMLMPDGVIKLIDFGCARRLKYLDGGASDDLLTSVHGTPYWMAPEVINETGHGRKSDVWSVGCTAFEMATGKPPLAHMNKLAAMFYIGAKKGPMPSLPGRFSAQAEDFVQICLTRDPALRPSAEHLVNHSFISKLE